jgi:NADPH:quinone reductase-like Zn-dependent oxidoreductase
LVLDLFGTRPARVVRQVLKPGGRYMMVGGPVPVLLNVVVLGGPISLFSSRKVGLLGVFQGPDRLAELLGMVMAGKLKPVIGEVARLENAAAALARMGAGEIAGKLVIVP